jgi:acetyltransferase-like isoleucine patch superfamily enzyme
MPIREYVVIEGECKIGKNLDTGSFVLIRSCTIGDDVCIWAHTTIDPGAWIGNRVKLHNGVYVSQGTIIRDDVFVGPHAIFLNDKYPPRYNKDDWTPAVVGEGAVIGGGAIICPGVYIGKHAIIAAGAVVTHDVPAGQLWCGVPAKQMRIVTRENRNENSSTTQSR